MRLPLVRVIRDLGGESNRTFERLLLGHLDATLAGARLAADVAAGVVSREQARELMRDIEHRGDEFRGLLVAELSESLVTPIDREDLFRLSRSIDDVLDNLRDFLHEWDLFQMKGAASLAPLLEAVIQALAALRGAVSVMVSAPSQITDRARASKKAGTQIRRLYELELAELYRGDVTMKVLKTRELLRRIDVVGLRLGEAADALSDGAVKRNA